tara:strand:+ start:3081 stop:6320 length:3240 start_codon:yes stop_codon:yes gene_type:complete
MGVLDDVRNAGRSALSVVKSTGNSLANSVDQIADSAGDFGRAVGRGDFSSAGSDLLSIGAEGFNLITYGASNIVFDALKRWTKPEIPEQDYEDRKVSLADADAARRIVYGTVRTGGVTRYAESSGENDDTLHLIVIFAAHSCDAVQEIYFGDKLAFIGTTPQGDFVDKAEVIIETGKQTVANASIVASTPAGWTNSHKLLGQTYAYFKLTYDTKVFGSAPRISATIRGKDDIYDPRTTLSGFTDNQALITRDYITNEFGFNSSNVLEQSFIDGANVCDELVTSGGGNTEKRYTANGTISIINEPQGALENILQAGSASIQYVQGNFIYIAGEYSAPSNPSANSDFNFSESDLIGGVSLSPTGDIEGRVNAARGTYIDPNQDFEIVDFVQLLVSQYETQDKEILFADTKFQFVNSGTTARRLSKIMLERSRFGVSISAKFRFKMLEFSVGDRIELSIDLLGWVDKVFRIESMEIGLDGIDCALLEDGPEVWVWQEGDALVVTAPPAVNLPNPRFVAKPQNIIASESLYFANDKKTIRSRLTLNWNGSVAVQRWEIQGSFQGGAYTTLSDFLTAPSFRFDDAQVGEWVFRVTATNSLGITSAFTELPFTSLGKTAPPENVAGFTGTVRPYSIELSWLPVSDIDLDSYEIRLGDTWETGELIQKLTAVRWSWEARPTGTERLFIKAIDTTGNYSDIATAAEIVILPPKAVTPLTAQVIDNNVLLRWVNATTSFAIEDYEVRRGDILDSSIVIGSVKSTFTAVFETESAVYRYWVAGIDVQGNTGPFSSIVANVDQPPDFNLLSNQLINLGVGNTVNLVNEIIPGLTFDDEDITFDDIVVTFDSDDQLALIGPANTTETWDEHFRAIPEFVQPLTFDDNTVTFDSETVTFDNDYQTIGELTATYPYYLQPTPTSASHEQVIDFGGLFNLSRIQITPDTEIIAGNPTVQYTLSYSDDDITYVDKIGIDTVGVDFRYVKVRADITSTSGLDIIRINSIRLRLDVKLRTDQGTGTALAGDVGGSQVSFGVDFVDIQSIQVTAKGTTAITSLYDFVDIPNPTEFHVYLFNSAGSRLSGDFSWTARGV